MKKFIFFLIIIGGLLCSTKTVYASSSFYEGEYIDNIYMNKRQEGSNTIFYQKARFFRQTGTNNFAYCIEPFNFFTNNGIYEPVIDPTMLSNQQKENISLIAYFGYGYNSHQDQKWYAITQFMIWKAADPTGDFYFTDKLNGNRIEKFTQEIAEINTLISNYKQNPSVKDKEYLLIEGQSLHIKDENNMLNYYQSKNSQFTIKDNYLTSLPLKEGVYNIKLTRDQKTYNKPIIFYQSKTSQALVETGDLPSKEMQLKVTVIKTEITIVKIDKDTNSIQASGEGELEGAIYQLYNSSNQPIQTITINENKQATLYNLPIGIYYLKEIKAGIGYHLDQTVHKIEITEKKPHILVNLPNEVIKKKIKIQKTYDEHSPKQEAFITFDIFDKFNKKVASITTDKNGQAEIILPYGTYYIKQVNTTAGYHKVADFEITVNDTTEIIYNLTDYKIKVPNTNTSFFKHLLTLFLNIIKWLQ